MSIKTMEKKAKIEFASVVKKRKKRKKKKKKKSERGCVVQTLFYF